MQLLKRCLLFAAIVLFATPLPALAAGTMMLRFRVNGPLDFTNVRYVIVFNTTGNGAEPYANAMTGLFNYSFAWVVGGSGGLAQPKLVQYFAVPGTGTNLQTREVVVPPQNAQLQVLTPSAPGEFTLTFSRSLFNTPSPAGARFSPLWSANFFTTDTAGHPIDANGTTGITDTSFSAYAMLNTAQQFDLRYFKPAGSSLVGNPSAAINQNEIINTP